MNRPRLIRWLRIAVSAVCVMVSALLVGLWVRSYSWYDGFSFPTRFNLSIGVGTFPGLFGIGATPPQPSVAMHMETDEILAVMSTASPPIHLPSQLWGGVLRQQGSRSFLIPYWFLVLLSIAFAFVPWIPWSTRFTTRTLLIVTTLVAVVLGLVVWWVR